MLELLLALSRVSAPSGFEHSAADAIKRVLERIGVDHTSAPDGAVVAMIKCGRENAPRLMLQAHMDEVGFMIKSHKEDGYLGIAPLGVTDPKLLVGRRVRVQATETLRGYIGAVPVHLSRGKSTPEYSDLYVHVGAASKADAERLVPLGSFGTFDTVPEPFGDGLVKGGALSSRGTCAVLLDTVKRIKEENITLPFDLYIAFTARGEIRISGSTSVYRRITPDAVISVVGTESGDTPEGGRLIMRLRDGIAVPYSEEKYAYHHGDAESLRSIADECGIRIQTSVPIPAGEDTDHDLLRLKNAGARLTAIRIPVRSRGSACEVVSISDLRCASDLLCAALKAKATRDTQKNNH